MVKYLPMIMNLVVIAIVAHTGVDSFYKVMGARLDSTPVVAAQARAGEAKQPVARRTLRDYQVVVSRDLFHTIAPPSQVEAPPAPVEDLQKTSLQVELMGTITGPDEFARAFIQDKKKRSSAIYALGDDVAGATLRQIMRGKVVLNVNGRDEILMMDDGSDSKKRSGRSPEPLPADPEGGDGQNITVERGEVQDALQNINQLMTQVNVRPHFEDGKPAGLMLRRIKPDSIFQNMGLQDGDVIQGVNDNEIKDTEDVLSLYRSLKSSDAVTLQIKRGGQATSLNYSFK